MGLKATGQLPSGNYLQKLQQSSNYKEGAFQNLSVTPVKPEGVSYWKMTRAFFKKHPHTEPSAKIPSIHNSLKNIPKNEPSLVWFGHSSYLLSIANKSFLIDPVFSGNAAPLSFMVKAFAGSNIYQPEDMPEIDYLIITHDHYDHLDYKTIKKLKHKVGHIYCSLGVGAHLKYWGIEEERITELDWWQKTHLNEEIELIATPARHFSGRGLKRAQSLWSSFVLKTNPHSIFIGGDSGYDTHFKQIGSMYGPFKLAILEAGQYNTMWPLIHMLPEEAVQAAIDLKAETLLPVHWGKFKLAMHPWNEPIKRIINSAKENNLPVFTPMIGQLLKIEGHFMGTNWWNL